MTDLLSRLEAATDEIAKRERCDRAVFTVCWVEEKGGKCICKEEAEAALRAREAT